MFKSKLSATAFPCIIDMAEIRKYVTASPGIDLEALDRVFLGRFAAMCRDLKIIGNINSGFREYLKQVKLYVATGGKQDASGKWYGGSPKVAKPGTSLHEFRLALDTDTPAIKAIDKKAATDLQTTLRKYGLFKPLTEGNKTGVFEDWHIQPIETRGVKDRASLQPVWDDGVKATLSEGASGNAVRELQILLVRRGYVTSIDGSFGPATKKLVVAFQKAHSLTPDGVVGPQTWKVLEGGK